MAFASERTESSNLSSFSRTDKFDCISVISKLKRLNDININPINKKKTYTSNNDSDVAMFKFPKPMDEIQEAWEKSNPKQETIEKVAKNYKSRITKVIGEIKHTLSKFKMKMHRLELESLKNEIMNQYDAKNIVSIVGCTISKLKELLKNQEELLIMSYHRQSVPTGVQLKSKKLPFYKYGKLNRNRNNNKNNVRSQSKMSQGERSLDDITEMNNANCIWNDRVSVETKSQKNYENVEFEKSYTSSTDAILEANKKMAFWEKRNRASILSEITANANWKHPATIGSSIRNSISAIERIVPDQYPTKTEKNSLEIKLISKKVQCARSSDNSDINSTCSTVPLFLIKNNNVLKAREVNKNIRICENKNKLYDRLESSFSCTRLSCTHNVGEPRPTGLRSCNSVETIITPRNTKRETSTETDLEVESVNSSISSTFSAYIVPSISHNTNNTGNSSETDRATIKSKGGIVDKKIFMNCEVVLEKI